MSFDNTLTWTNVIEIVSAFLMFSGGVFTFIQWKKSIKIKRSEYINELTKIIRSDVDISEVIYIFEYENEWYNLDFHGGPLERQVDKTLSYFSYICYLIEFRIISDKEFMFFKYEIIHLLMNKGVVDYLYNIYHYSKRLKTPLTFYYLFNYGKKHGCFDEDFFNASSHLFYRSQPIENQKYHNYLNF